MNFITASGFAAQPERSKVFFTLDFEFLPFVGIA